MVRKVISMAEYYKVCYRTDAYGGPVGSPKEVDVTKNRMAPITRKKFLLL